MNSAYAQDCEALMKACNHSRAYSVGKPCSCVPAADAGCIKKGDLAKEEIAAHKYMMGQYQQLSPEEAGQKAEDYFWTSMQDCKNKEDKNSAPQEASIPTQQCLYDSKAQAFDEKIEAFALEAETVKRLILLDLPEYPVSEFTITSDKKGVEIILKDLDSWSQFIVDKTDFLSSVGGLFLDAPPAFDLMKFFKNDIDFIGSGPTTIALLDELKAMFLDQKKGSLDNGDDIVEFVKDYVTAIENVAHVRQKIVCGVKENIPYIFTEYEDLTQMYQELKSDAENNPACNAAYVQVIKDKINKSEAKKLYQWHANGISGIQYLQKEDKGYIKYHTWLDQSVNAQYEPRIFEEVQCQ